MQAEDEIRHGCKYFCISEMAWERYRFQNKVIQSELGEEGKRKTERTKEKGRKEKRQGGKKERKQVNRKEKFNESMNE